MAFETTSKEGQKQERLASTLLMFVLILYLDVRIDRKAHLDWSYFHTGSIWLIEDVTSPCQAYGLNEWRPD